MIRLGDCAPGDAIAIHDRATGEAVDAEVCIVWPVDPAWRAMQPAGWAARNVLVKYRDGSSPPREEMRTEDTPVMRRTPRERLADADTKAVVDPLSGSADRAEDLFAGVEG